MVKVEIGANVKMIKYKYPLKYRLADKFNALLSSEAGIFLLSFSAVLAAAVVGSAVKRGIENSKDLKNSTFAVVEHTILAEENKCYVQYSKNRDIASYSYVHNFFVDVNEDGFFDKDVDIVVSLPGTPMAGAGSNGKLVYVERKREGLVARDVLAVSDARRNYNIISGVTDVYNPSYWDKNVSFKRADKLFREKYLKQR